MSAPAAYEAMTYPSINTPSDEQPAVDDLEIDLEGSEDQDEADDQDGGEDTAQSAGNKAKNQAKANRALIRRAAAKTVEVIDAGEETRKLAAILLGCSADPADLAASIMTAPRASGSVLSDLDEIAEALAGEDSWEAGIIAASLERGAQKDLWTLLYALDAVGAPTAPVAAPKAGRAIVKAVESLSEESRAGLSAAGELIKRS